MFDKKPFSRKGNYPRKIDKSLILNRSNRTKRGALSALMSEEAKATGNIQDLSYDFACRIIRLYQYLTEPINGERYSINDDNNPSSNILNPSSTHEREYIMSKQVYRSGTSIGANVREGQHAQSDSDFLSKMSIAYKEADESNYWIKLLHDNGYLNDEQYNSLNNDNQRLLRLLSSIVKTTKEKIARSKDK